MVTLYDINKALEIQDFQKKPLEQQIPKEYHAFLSLFDKIIAERLPQYKLYAHKITL
jgi:hypothetical protein